MSGTAGSVATEKKLLISSEIPGALESDSAINVVIGQSWKDIKDEVLSKLLIAPGYILTGWLLEKTDDTKIELVDDTLLTDEAIRILAVLEKEETQQSDVVAVYLDGASGDDNNNGLTKETAFKTFEKAKSFAAENNSVSIIYVSGTTTVSGDISLSGTNAKILREKDFAGYLFRVESGNSASLSDIVIDGGGNLPTGKKSLINVAGTLNICGGAVLENNIIENTSNSYTKGGAVETNASYTGLSHEKRCKNRFLY